MTVKYTCPYCGGDEILREAIAIWDIDHQRWVLINVYDDFTCNKCGESINSPNKEVN